MSSSIKLKNANGKTVSVTNSNANKTDKEVIYLNTVDELANASGSINAVAIVSDINRGGTFEWSATGTANGGTVFAGVSGYWNRQYSGAVNVKWFGAVGNGVTDDTVAIQGAISVFSNIFIPKGTYYITNAIFLNKNTTVTGEGVTTIVKTAPTVSRAFSIGELNSTTYSSLTIAAEKNSIALSFNNELDLDVGDIILATNSLYNYTSGGLYNYGALGDVVKKVDNLNILLSYPIHNTTTYDTVTIYKNAKDVSIMNLCIDVTSGTSSSQTLGIRGVCSNFLAMNLTINGSIYGQAGISIIGNNQEVKNCLIDGFINSTGIPDGGRLGYGINLNGNGNIIQHNYVKNCKHCITSAERRFSSKGLKILDNTAIHTQEHQADCLIDTPIDIHASVWEVIIANNTVTSALRLMSIRGTNAIIKNNTMSTYLSREKEIGEDDTYLPCAFVVSEYKRESLLIESNNITLLGNNSKLFSHFNPASSALRVEDNYNIVNNILYNCPINLGYNNYYKNITVANNKLISTNLSAILFEGTSTLNNVVIDNNYIEYGSDTLQTSYGIYTNTTLAHLETPIIISRNVFKRLSVSDDLAYNIYITAANKYIIDNNIFDYDVKDNTSSYTYPLSNNTQLIKNASVWDRISPFRLKITQNISSGYFRFATFNFTAGNGYQDAKLIIRTLVSGTGSGTSGSIYSVLELKQQGTTKRLSSQSLLADGASIYYYYNNYQLFLYISVPNYCSGYIDVDFLQHGSALSLYDGVFLSTLPVTNTIAANTVYSF